MTIINKSDLNYPIRITNNQNQLINVSDCDSFIGKYYTADKTKAAVSKYENNTYTNIIDNDIAIINSADLSSMNDGVLNYEYIYSVTDNTYEDHTYNVVVSGNTNYYIKPNNNNPVDPDNPLIVVWGEINGRIDDQTDITQILNNKVDKEEGKSLIDDSEIIRLSSITNYDDSTIKTDIINKVDKLSGKSLIDNSEIIRLSSITNYDDSAIKTLINTSLNNRITAIENDIAGSKQTIIEIKNII